MNVPPFASKSCRDAWALAGIRAGEVCSCTISWASRRNQASSFSANLHSFFGDGHTWMIVLQNSVQVQIPAVAAATRDVLGFASLQPCIRHRRSWYYFSHLNKNSCVHRFAYGEQLPFIQPIKFIVLGANRGATDKSKSSSKFFVTVKSLLGSKTEQL